VQQTQIATIARGTVKHTPVCGPAVNIKLMWEIKKTYWHAVGQDYSNSWRIFLNLRCCVLD